MREPRHEPWAGAVRALWGTAIAGLLLAATGQAPGTARAGRAAEPPAFDRERVPRELKGIVLKTVDGRSLALDSLEGQVVVLNFWASWCTPCRRELPHLDALQATLQGRGARVVAISIDEEARNVQRFAREQHLTLPLYHDGPDHLARRLDLPHVPFTIVLDRRGEVALVTSGADEQALQTITETTRRLMAAADVPSPTLAGETR